MAIDPRVPTDDELVGALDALTVPFLMGGVQDELALSIAPAELLQGLAQSPDARVRSAIIPLLLRHPEFAQEAQRAAARLPRQPQYTLECFYTAAMLLQKRYAERLGHLFGEQAALPDLFSEVLEVDVADDIDEALGRVGQRNAELSGLAMNWTGGYRHAAQSWLDYLEWRAERRRQPTWQNR